MKIVLEKGQNLYFTSDTHYGHSNICRATTNWTDADSVTRDFKSLDHMNDTIVDNINSIVGEDDVLIHLGDWSFGGFENIAEFRGRIVCKNVHLTYGNHDHHIRRNKDDIQSIFSSTQDYMHLDIRRPSSKGKGLMDKFSFICMHYPIASWDSMNANMIHLHGHTHLPKHLRIADGRAMDVGMDGNDLEPISLDEVIRLLKDQPIKKLCLPKDHHEKRI
jgi:calcineurin-like phosphoesterase family protein